MASLKRRVAYCSLGVRYDGVEHLRFRLEDSTLEDIWIHTQYGMSYWMTQDIPYDSSLGPR
jgi:hypothetical protein